MSLSVIPESGIQFNSRISYGFSLKHAITLITYEGGTEVSPCRIDREVKEEETYFGFTSEEGSFCIEDLVELEVIKVEIVLLLCLAFDVRHRCAVVSSKGFQDEEEIVNAFLLLHRLVEAMQPLAVDQDRLDSPTPQSIASQSRWSITNLTVSIPSSSGRSTSNPTSTYQPRWRTREFYFYYAVFLIVVPQMYSSVVKVSSGSFNLFSLSRSPSCTSSASLELTISRVDI